MTRGPLPRTLARNRALLILILIRQAISIVAIVAVLVLAFQLPDRRFAYLFAPVAAVFVAVTIGMAVRWIGKYRARRRALERSGEAS